MPQLMQFILALAFLQVPSLDSPSPRERREAIEAMATLGNRDAVPVLAEAYKTEPNRDLRASIVAALGRIRDRSAIPALTEALLRDFDKDVRLQAIDSFMRLYIPVADSGGFFTFIDRVRQVFSPDDRPLVGPGVYVEPETRQVLVEALENDFNPEVRSEAAYTLGSLRAVDELPALVEAVQGPRNRQAPEVRRAAVQAMGILRSPEAGPALVSLLRDSDSRVAEEAIRSVGMIGYRPAFQELSQLFRTSRDRRVREAALQSIALLREPSAVPLFESLLDDRTAKYRELAAEGLARVDYDAAPLAPRISRERDAGVRLALSFALATSGETAYIQQLVDALDTRRDHQAEIYLLELGRYEGQLSEIHPHLRNADADIRAKLVTVVGDIGNPDSRSFIEPLTRDRNTDVQRAAVDALRKLSAAQ